MISEAVSQNSRVHNFFQTSFFFFDKIDWVILTLAFFKSYYSLQLYNEGTPARALPSKFWEIFEIFSKIPTGKYFCSF